MAALNIVFRSVRVDHAANEVVVLTWTYHQEDRRRSYELLAAAQREKEGKK